MRNQVLRHRHSCT